ncbi:MAG: DUF1178 family protein [Pseudomonadota bacterium]
MISYNLRCAKDHEFEGWFKDSSAFQAQQDAGDIECPLCGDRHIEQALSRPNIATGRQRDAAKQDAAIQMRQALKDFRRKVESTHEDVGTRFAEEARKIHYGEVEERGIYGKATAEEATGLLEEGVAVAPIPWVEDKQDN